MNAHHSDYVKQDATRPTADQHFETWSDEDIEFVRETLEERVEDVAEALGRTYYAIWGMRARLAAPRARRTVRGLPDLAITSWDAWEAQFDD